MKVFQKFLSACLLGIAATVPAVSLAQVDTTTNAEVRKIDKESGKITLKHGEIKNLDMPPMTMVFQVRDPAMLDKLKAGDKVRFKVVSEAGKMTITDIAPAP